jgi:hypothetical protein
MSERLRAISIDTGVQSLEKLIGILVDILTPTKAAIEYAVCWGIFSYEPDELIILND